VFLFVVEGFGQARGNGGELEGKANIKNENAKIQRKNQKSWFPGEEVVDWAEEGKVKVKM
jgi:hypothetical protein